MLVKMFFFSCDGRRLRDLNHLIEPQFQPDVFIIIIRMHLFLQQIPRCACLYIFYFPPFSKTFHLAPTELIRFFISD